LIVGNENPLTSHFFTPPGFYKNYTRDIFYSPFLDLFYKFKEELSTFLDNFENPRIAPPSAFL